MTRFHRVEIVTAKDGFGDPFFLRGTHGTGGRQRLEERTSRRMQLQVPRRCCSQIPAAKQLGDGRGYETVATKLSNGISRRDIEKTAF